MKRIIILLFVVVALECRDETSNPVNTPFTQNDIIGKWRKVREIDKNRCVQNGIVTNSNYKERDSSRWKEFRKISSDSICKYWWDTASFSTGPSYEHDEDPYYLSNDSILGDAKWNGEMNDSILNKHGIWSTTLKFDNNLLVETFHNVDYRDSGKVCEEWEIMYLERYYDTIPPPNWPQIPYP